MLKDFIISFRICLNLEVYFEATYCSFNLFRFLFWMWKIVNKIASKYIIQSQLNENYVKTVLKTLAIIMNGRNSNK